jgi:CRISPR-associated protein Cmr3
MAKRKCREVLIMQTYAIHTGETLVFRDGRPFGDAGNVDGGMINWPRPSTVAGMLRTRIGTSRSSHYFDRSDPNWQKNIDAVKSLCFSRVLPIWRPIREDGWQYLFPAPADAVIGLAQDGTNRISVHGYDYQPTDSTFGTDITWSNWRIPITASMEKPPSRRPAFWTQAYFVSWLRQTGFPAPVSPAELGFDHPIVERRLHTAINPDTFSAAQSQLFASYGIRMETSDPTSQILKPHGRFGIAAAVANSEAGDDPTGICFLGADRHTAWVDSLDAAFPACPEWFTNCQFLRIILITPGDFGQWVPDWLCPDIGMEETPWCRVPGCEDIEVRLVSAVLGRWEALSGWDYAKRGPKATRKLVPAGSVYLIEVKNPKMSQQLACHLWGNSLCPGSSNDGFGCVCVGTATLT